MAKKKNIGVFIAVVWGHWEARFGTTFALMLAVAQYAYLAFGDPNKLPKWVKDFPPSMWLAVGGLLLFWACYEAWHEERTGVIDTEARLEETEKKLADCKPQLGLWADEHSFYLTHLQGDPAQFIEIEPIFKRPNQPQSTKLHFEPIDFLSSAMTACQKALTMRLEILPGDKKQTDMGKVIAIMFSGYSRPSASFPVTIKFRWNHEEMKERIILTWISEEKRFETKQR